jgi:Fe-S-cluster-containing hydrogenase component 2
MEYIGLNPERLTIEFMSGAEANLFVDSVNGFVKLVKTLGPLGKSEGMDQHELKSKLAETIKLVPYIKLVNQDKLASRFNTREEHHGLFTQDEIEGLFRDVVSYYIDPTKCRACSTCLKQCPVEAIDGGKNLIHVIDQEKCIKCGTCLEVCPPRFSAVTKISGEPVPPPIPEEERTIKRKTKRDAEQDSTPSSPLRVETLLCY